MTAKLTNLIAAKVLTRRSTTSNLKAQLLVPMAISQWTAARDVSSEVMFLHQGRIAEQEPPGEMSNNPRSDESQGFIAKVK